MSPKIRWAHAANSMKELDDAMKADLDAIEVDISWNDVHKVAVMRHAQLSKEPIETECLASEWIEKALSSPNFKLQIVKLDFKNLLAVPSVIDILEQNLKANSPMIFLNADILAGPGAKPGALPPIEARTFLDYCERIPEATLSLGWTTAYSPFETLKYEPAHIEEMLLLLERAKHRTVTFPIRASLAKESWPVLSRLLKHSPNTSITLWTAHEGVPQEELDWLVQACEVHQIYIDCDKGPKHPHWHPMRLLQYEWSAIGRWFMSKG